MNQNGEPVYLSLEFTPNPNTLKYAVNRVLLNKGAVSFTSLASAKEASPLAERLLGTNGIEGVMIGRDFVTVTKSESGDWEAVHKTASEVIESHLNANETVLFEEKDAAQTEGANEVEQKIIDLLEKEIRPAVAMDGGDITFDRFDEGIVYLFLQGSCAGCPSATMTLQQGIEVRLKELIPEVKQVVSTN